MPSAGGGPGRPLDVVCSVAAIRPQSRAINAGSRVSTLNGLATFYLLG
jgi:hypothetical protein